MELLIRHGYALQAGCAVHNPQPNTTVFFGHPGRPPHLTCRPRIPTPVSGIIRAVSIWVTLEGIASQQTSALYLRTRLGGDTFIADIPHASNAGNRLNMDLDLPIEEAVDTIWFTLHHPGWNTAPMGVTYAATIAVETVPVV